MQESLDRIVYVRLADLEGDALDAFAASGVPAATRSAVVRAAVVKWLVESGNLPSDYSTNKRAKHKTRMGRETVFDMTRHDKISA